MNIAPGLPCEEKVPLIFDRVVEVIGVVLWTPLISLTTADGQ